MIEVKEELEIRLINPFKYIANPETIEAEYLLVRTPSYAKKMKVLKLRKIIAKLFFNYTSKFTNDSKDNQSPDPDSSMDEKVLKNMMLQLLYTEANDQEFEKICDLCLDLLTVDPISDRDLKVEQMPCLINGEHPFKKINQVKVSADDWENVLCSFLGNFILASLMKTLQS